MMALCIILGATTVGSVAFGLIALRRVMALEVRHLADKHEIERQSEMAAEWKNNAYLSDIGHRSAVTCAKTAAEHFHVALCLANDKVHPTKMELLQRLEGGPTHRVERINRAVADYEKTHVAPLKAAEHAYDRFCAIFGVEPKA